jgi:dolichyl-phosphate-mannose-protein mannosyltransferase
LSWRDPTQFRSAAFVLWVVFACAVTWTVLPAILLGAPHGDNIEQLNWAQAFEWGYFKHPPLPTWLLRAAIDVFGPSALLTYAVAMACVALALMLLWLCARELMEPRHALIALLVSTANYYLMGRGSYLNHNTVMLPFVALSAWAVLRIVRGAGWSMWLVLGLAQALGLLTKYQMSLIIVANGTALLAAGVYRQPRFAAHVALASAATVLPLVPHALWLAHNQFSTFEYASHSLLAGLQLTDRLIACGSFLAQQLARLAPALVALVLLIVFAPALTPGAGATPETEGAKDGTEVDQAKARALTILALMPIVGITLLVLAAGVAPQNHWGSTLTILIPLLLVTRLRPTVRQSIGAAFAATALCQAGAIAWYVTAWKVDPGPDQLFAARPLAALAQQHWSSHEGGPIRLVIGPDWEAGSIALYLPGHPVVLANGNWRHAPWIDPDLLSHCGALIIASTDLPLERQISPSEAATAIDRTLLKATDSLGHESTVQAALILPTPSQSCR